MQKIGDVSLVYPTDAEVLQFPGGKHFYSAGGEALHPEHRGRDVYYPHRIFSSWTGGIDQRRS